MTARSMTTGLGVVALAGALVAARFAAWPLVPVERRAARPLGAPAARDSSRRVSVESLAVLVARDPFRVGRRPAGVAYDPLRLAEQLAPPAPRPVLALVGVVSGAEPTAVVEGFPGVAGVRVVRVGDVVAGVRVVRIEADRVRLAGMDTVWVLKVREPWK